ncbi:Nucleophosmin [Desmophyllum pertusum]|uniref:Nucleophosmin n=1 Tax=Desmophyllum pertusum TaxID=174260 RepID=A0A9W9ZPL0_9CNID|nr:Nucleophosmin [Desmophyllum pertusum]
MASMEKEFFWGCELSKDKKEYSWDSEDEELSKADIEQKLVVTQACLGIEAKANQKNVIQVTTTDSSDNTCRLGLGFPSSVVFKLIEGNGPVHLTGSVYQELYLLDDEEESDDDDDEDGELVKTETKETTKKRPLAVVTPKGPPRKVARVEAEDEEESDDEDDDDEDDESEESTEESTKMEVDVKQKPKKQPAETLKTTVRIVYRVILLNTIN